MKIFLTNKKFKKFKKNLEEKTYFSGFENGKETGIKMGIAMIRKKFNLVKKEKRGEEKVDGKNNE